MATEYEVGMIASLLGGSGKGPPKPKKLSSLFDVPEGSLKTKPKVPVQAAVQINSASSVGFDPPPGIVHEALTNKSGKRK